MITKPTVFILGAGASFPYNYPLGKKLVQEVIDNLQNKKALYQLCEGLEFKSQEINSFCSALRLSGDFAIDSFLERNAEFIELGKVLIVLSLFKRETTDILFSDGDGKWYGDLVNELKSPSIKDFNNQVSFLTFNYDRSFDHYLFTSIKHSYGLSDSECTSIVKSIPIIHLHGQIGKLPWQDEHGKGRPYQNTLKEIDIIIKSLTVNGESMNAATVSSARHYIKKISGQIKIIHEKELDREPGFNEAHKLLSEAEKIYFLGFGYNDENLRRLKIAELSNKIDTKTKAGIITTKRIIDGTSCGIGEAKIRHIQSVTNGRINLNKNNNKVLEFLNEKVDFE
jgi:hypothetical protein